MAIDVYCNCGSTLTVSPELAGRKVRCKKCDEVLQIPSVPMDQSVEAASGPEDYEVVSEEAVTRTCPACGATASAEDTACLACGADLGKGGLGILEKVPAPVLVGALVLVLVGLLWLGWSTMSRMMAPGQHVEQGNGLRQQAEREAQGGNAAEAQRLYQQAEREFKAALALDKKHKGALVGLARVALATESPALLKRHALEALEVMDDAREKARLRVAYGWTLLDDGSAQEANNQAIDAKGEDADAPGVEAIRGLAALAAGNKEDALKHLSKVPDSLPKGRLVVVYERLAELLREKARHGEARAAAEKLVRLKDDEARYWLLVARLRDATGDGPGKKDALVKAGELDTQNAEIMSELSRVYLAEKRLDDALKAAEKAASIDGKNHKAQVAVGLIHLARGRPGDAVGALERALKLEPEDAEALFLLGKAQLQAGAPNEGVKSLQASFNKDASHIERFLDAAQVALAADRAQVAIQLLERVRARRHYQVHVLMAEAHAKLPNGPTTHRKVIHELLSEALAIDSRRKEAPLALAKQLLRDGQGEVPEKEREEARALLDRALKVHAGDLDLLLWKGIGAVKARDWSAAIDSLKACLKERPDWRQAETWLREAESGKFYDEKRE